MTKKNINNQSSVISNYLSLATANNRFNSFGIRPKRRRWIGKAALVFVLTTSLLIGNMVPFASLARDKLRSIESEKVIKNSSENEGNLAEDLRLIPEKTDFRFDEEPKFKLRVGKKLLDEGISLGPSEVRAAEESIKTFVFYKGNPVAVQIEVSQDEGGDYDISFKNTVNLKPGKYTLQTTILENGAVYQSEQDFTWGVLAINTNKSIYKPGETVKFSFAVLDDGGDMVCNALLKLSIINYQLSIKDELATEDGTIKVNPGCRKKEMILEPDYEAEYRVDGPGIYEMELTALTPNGIRSITDNFEVREWVAFDIERNTATRIYPKATYPVKLTIGVNEDFKGEVVETVPVSFEIISEDTTSDFSTSEMKSSDTSEVKHISWGVNWKKGERYELSYEFKAPNKSPAFYTLGPLRLSLPRAESRGSGSPRFTETRRWQIAADATDTFRVTTYELEDATYTGATYTLTLNNNLVANYFAMVAGANDETGSRGPDDDGVRVTDDPFGTSTFPGLVSANQIELTRGSSINDWTGSVTVVECLNDCTTSGFQLSEVREVTLAAGTANTLQTVTDTLSAVHTSRTVPFGSYFGGGMESSGTDANTYAVTLGVRIYKTSTNVITYERYGAESRVPAAGTVTTYIVEWGSGWTVQSVNVTGTNSGEAIDATAEYNTASITSVARDNTWVWGVGHARDDGLSDGAFGQVTTLGDGVSQNTNETLVAVGAEGAQISPGRDFQVYTMTHSNLAVDHRKKPDGDTGASSGYQELTLAIDGATGSETYDNVSSSVRDTEGYRIPIIYTSSNLSGNGQAYSRPIWAPRITADTTLLYWRAYAGQALAGWAQIVDFAGIATGPITQQLHFRWRDDTTDLNTTGGWLAVEDSNAISDISKSTTYRLRIESANTGDAVESASRTYELQWGEDTGSGCNGISTWTGLANASDEFDMVDTTNISPDGESATPGLLANSESYTFVTGEGRDVADTTGSIGAMPASNYTELEYSFEATSNATAGATYCFRLYDTTAGSALDLYLVYPQATIQASTLAIGEYGTTTISSGSSQAIVTLNNDYEDVIVVASVGYSPTTDAQRAPRIISKTNGLSSDFTVQIASSSAVFTTQDTVVDWIAMESGAYTIPNGLGATKVIAGSVNTNGTFCRSDTITGTPDVVTFTPNFDSSPAVLTTVASNNDTAWAVTHIDDNSVIDNEPTVSTMRVTLNVSYNSCTTAHGAEDVDYIAFDVGHGTNNSVDFDAVVTGPTTCCSAGGVANNFYSSFSTAPEVYVIGQMGEDGGDGSYAVTHTGTAVTASTHYSSVDEDGPSADRSHSGAEEVAIISFDASSGTIETNISYNQSAYRWFENVDSTDVGSPMAATNSAATLSSGGQAFRLRALLHIGAEDLHRYGGTFKLQFAQQSGTCDTAFAGESYTDVTGATTIAYNNNTPTDGAVLTANVQDPDHSGHTRRDQSYEELNNFSNTQVAVASGEDGMWDFALVDNTAPDNTTYCFRIVISDGTALDTYTVVPEITTVPENGILMLGLTPLLAGMLRKFKRKKGISGKLN